MKTDFNGMHRYIKAIGWYDRHYILICESTHTIELNSGSADSGCTKV